jgi:uncharacterized protein YjdB
VVSCSNGVITAKNYGTATIYAETFNGKKGSIKIVVKEITAEKVTISGLPDATFCIGDKFFLLAHITPENVDNSSIVWKSSNSEIATVSSKGLVELLSEGNVEISATASNGVVGKVAINVKEKYVDTVDIAASEVDMLINEESTITATVSPADATHPELTWTSADPAIVSVSADGRITALACGETIITATSTNNISDSIAVRVTEIKAQYIQVKGSASARPGNSFHLIVNFIPENTTDQQIRWIVDNTDIATISDDGLFTAKNVGVVNITVMQKDVSSTHTINILPVNVEGLQSTPKRKVTPSNFVLKTLPQTPRIQMLLGVLVIQK